MARLLIIEDGVPLASLLVSATSARGHLTTAAHSGREGLTLAREEPFALAVVDLLLPDLRGAQVLETLRDLGVPCIAMSGVFKGDRFARDAVEQHGARAFFEKPFELNALLDAIDGIVGAQPFMDELHESGALDDLDIDLDEESGVLELRADDIVDDELTPRTATPYLPTADAHDGVPAGDAAGRMTPVIPAPGHELDGDQVEVPTGHATQVSAEPPEAVDEAEVSFAGVLEDEPAHAPSEAPDGDDRSFAGVIEDASSAPTASATTDDDPSFTGVHEVEHPAPSSDDVVPSAQGVNDDFTFPDVLGDEPPAPSTDSRTVPSARGVDDDLSFAGILDEAISEGPRPTSEAAALLAEAPGGDAAFDGLLASLDSDAAAPIAQDESAPRLPDAATPFSDRGQVWAVPSPVAPPLARASVSSELVPSALVGLLNACHQSRFTGSLELSTDGDDLSLRFRSGRAVGAVTSRPEGAFTQFCVDLGALPLEKKDELDAVGAQEELAPVELLARLDLLDPEGRVRLASDHLRALAWRALSWTGGTSRLVSRDSQTDASVQPSPSVSVPELIFEGILATAELDGLREALPESTRLTPTADPPYELGELPLNGPQAYVLAHADGSKSISDLLVLSDLDERGLLATLHAMVQLGILEPRRPARATRRITYGL